MQLTLQAKNKAGTGILSGDKWYNMDKKANLDISNVGKGDLVEIEQNEGGFVTKLTVVKKGDKPAYTGGTGGYTGGTRNNTEEIARSTAIKAVFGSPLLAQQYAEKDTAEAISDLKALAKSVTDFILKGEFSPVKE